METKIVLPHGATLILPLQLTGDELFDYVENTLVPGLLNMRANIAALHDIV